MIYNWFYTSQIVSRISSINSMLHASFKAILGGDVPFKGDVTVHPYSNKGVFSAVELSDVGQRLTNTAQHPHFSCGQQNRMALQHLCLSIDRQSSMLCIGIICVQIYLCWAKISTCKLAVLQNVSFIHSISNVPTGTHQLELSIKRYQ